MSELESINKTDIEWIKCTLAEIKTQTTKTNGRVNKLEDRTGHLEHFKKELMFIASGVASVVAFLANKLI